MGFGTPAGGIITRGFGELVLVPIIAEERPLRLRMVGQSGTKRREKELLNIVIQARMLELNGMSHSGRPISGYLNVNIDPDDDGHRIIIERLDNVATLNVPVVATFVGRR